MPDMWMDVDTALSKVPINLLPILDDTDFKTIETGLVYNQGGLNLVWNFRDTAGNKTKTAVTPTNGGTYAWSNDGDGMYSIALPASGGGNPVNNDTEGFGWFTGVATGVLPYRGPVIGLRAARLNDLWIDGVAPTFDDMFRGALRGDSTWPGQAAMLAVINAGGTGLYDNTATPDANLKKLNDSAVAAAILASIHGAVRKVTVDNTTFTPTTTAFETDQTGNLAARYTEQQCFWISGTNAGLSTPVTGYAFTNGKVKLTVEAMAAAPSNGDQFIIMGRIEQ